MKVDIEKEIRKYIKDLYHLSLATSSGDKPWICEVHFAYDDDLNLYFMSKASRRHSQEIATNPNVAGNIIRTHSLEDKSVLGVYFEGAAEQCGASTATKCAEALAKRFGRDSAAILEEAKLDDGHKLYKITVENWYLFGRFGESHSTKLKLEWNGNKSER